MATVGGTMHSINRQLTTGLGGVILLVAILVVGILWAIGYGDSRDQRIHDDYFPQLTRSEQLRTGMVEQQSGLRGYIITGDERFLESFEAGRSLYVRARDELSAGPDISQEAAALRDRQIVIADTWYDEVAVPEIEQVRSETLSADRQRAVVEESQVQGVAFREVNDAYNAAIRDEITHVSDEATDLRNLIFLIAALGGVVVLLMALAMSIRTIRAIHVPLVALGDVVEAIDAGDTSRRVPRINSMEFDRLGQGINRMLDSLARTGVETAVQRSRFETIVESANEGIVVIDPDGTVTDINPAAQHLFDTDAETAVGHDAADLGFFSEAELRGGLDLAGAIDRTLATLRPLTEEKRLSVLRELDDEAATVLADEARLQQILTNLVSNASKYTQEGGWITVRSESLDGQIAVSVSDTGLGIPPEALPQVFSKFYRVDRPAVRDAGGTGLGLAITKSLVEMHGGRVNIASRVGVGTTVRFTIPSARGSQVAEFDDLRFPAGASSRVLIATPDEDERTRLEQSIADVSATPIHTRGVSVAAIVSEVELHRPGVIVVRVGRADQALPRLSELREELDANPDIERPRLIAIVSHRDEANPREGEILLDEDASHSAVADAVRSVLPEAPAERVRRGRVLVADDDADTAAWVRRVLVNGGYEVTIVRDGLAAIVRTIEILPDAVILDVNMPKMGASEVLPQLRSNPGTRDIPVIVMTGTVPDSRPYFMELGASEFLTKPFPAELLVQRVVELGKQSRNG